MKQQMNQVRENQFDLLKIVGMLMIIALHVMTHGVQFPTTSHANLSSLNYILCMLLRSICIVAVNCYFLISGYFLIQQKFKSKKILNLWGIVFFYVVIFLIIFSKSYHINLEFTIKSLCTITSGEYWFFTAYIFLFILSPVLNVILHKLNQQQLKLLLSLLILIFMTVGIISPYNDMLNGEDLILNAIIIYCVGAYIKLYGSQDKDKIRKGYFLKYLVIVFVITCLAIIFHRLYIQTGNKAFELYYNRVFSYGFILCFMGAVYLFLSFKEMKIKSKWANKIITIIQPLTFAVYIIHDNVFVRKIWSGLPIWLQGDQDFYIFTIFFSIISMFLICCMIEYGRKVIFQFIGKLNTIQKGKQKLDHCCEKIDQKINGIIEGGEGVENT